MLFNRTAVFLSATCGVSLLIHACQAEVIQDNRGAVAGGRPQPAAAQAEDATGADSDQDQGADQVTQDTQPEADKDKDKPAPLPPTVYSMSWDASADPGVVSYKVFLVTPDRNPRFPGKTDVPLPIKNLPLAALQKDGTKYTVKVNSDEVKAALGTTVVNPTAYCFTIVAVNAVGNSAHSPVICP